MKMLLPLLAGIVVAAAFKISRRPAIASLGRSCGVLMALTFGYFAHFAMLNFAYADGETLSQKVMLTVSETSSQFLAPSTAIQWLPVIAKACLAVTWLVPSLQRSGNSVSLISENHNDYSSQVQSRLTNSLTFTTGLTFAALVMLAAGSIIYLLWSTVYLTDRYTLLSQISYVSIPAVIMAFIWMGGFRQSSYGQATSRWTVASTIGLSISTMVLLVTSGSFTFGLLQMPVIAAALVGFAFYYPSTKRSPANHDAWLITCAISLPIALGFFFAEVRWETAALFAVSAALATWLTPGSSNSNFSKAAIAFSVCLPAIAASVWSAIEFSQAVKSPYG